MNRTGVCGALPVWSACALSLLAAVAACGGGEQSNTPTTDASSNSPSCASTIKLQLFGDSTQVAAYKYGFLRSELHDRFGSKVIVELRAVSNSDSQQLRDGTDGLNAPWPQSADGDIVVINHGINDAKRRTDYAANLRAFVGPRVVFETPNPVHDQRYDTAANAALMREIGTKTIDVHGYVAALPDWQAMVPDGVHPNATLHALIAQNVTAPALAPLIAERLCGN